MIDTKNKIIFIHIGKTGGSSITASLLSLQGITHTGKFFSRDLKENYKAGHAHGSELKSYVESIGESWDDYYKFSIVRCPYTRLASHYKFFNYDKKMKWHDYLVDDERLNFEVPLMYDYIHEDGKCLVDDIFRFEDGFDDIYRSLEVRYGTKLNRLHAKNNTARRKEVHLDDKAIKLIGDRYDMDFKTFGYTKL